MKHLKFTYVDAVTGVPVTDAPAANGPAFPDVEGLEFIWARESQYPTDAPEFFGTCPDESFALVPGVIDVIGQADWEQMQRDEMRARVPKVVSRAQFILALLDMGLLDDVEAAIAQADRATQINYQERLEFERGYPLIATMAAVLGKTDAEIDALFVLAATK